MNLISRSTVMQAAWKLIKADATLSAAMSQAWKEAKIKAVKEALTLGFVWITFRKVDGTLTTRKATRNADLMPDPNKPKSSAAAGEVIPFYSETDHGWRSFKCDNLVSFKVA
jgi:hypothetical protein